ncbi:MAG: hypothetical protein VYB17_01525 [Candidatus Thermoplasmatota archaeon]|nr:hypothetical protein [Candidatus Thermoplasmatota archaeon]
MSTDCKRTLRVRTVLNVARLQQSVRRLAPLLVLLFLIPSFSGCIGGPSVTWGTSDGEYSTSISSDSSTGLTTTSISVTNKLASSTSRHLDADELELEGCDNSTYSISGWLVQTKIFDQPQTTNHAITSWMIMEMPYSEAQDVEPGSIYVSVVNSEKDWPSPNQAEGTPIIDGVAADGKANEFPHRKWTLLAIVPANENVFDAALQMATNQAIKLNGYLVQTESINEDQISGCKIDASSSGWGGHFVVTSMKYGDERIVNSDEVYVAGDIPVIGRGLYTTILLISIVASGALYIFSRNQIMLNADTQAQAMLSEQQMRAGKAARHEAARHEARMAATVKSKESEYTGKPTKKSAVAPKFDIRAALAEDTPGSNTGHYVAGSSVTSTEEAEAMEGMISEMQEEQAFEQELQEKGLRNIIGDMPKDGGSGKRRSIATKPHTSRLASDAEKVESEPKKKPTRRTRKTRSAEPEPEPVEEEVEEEVPTRRNVDPEVNDEGDFSDFSL